MHSIYNLFIAIYGAILRVASLFSHKISTMCEGESKAFDVLSAIKPDDKVVWFHCASLGEFEQGRMLIESLKRQQPDFKILLSFYSPSGYEVRKNYSYADWVVYLPNDTAANARKFVSLANPLLTFFVKYEFWYNYLIALDGRRVFQVSLIMRPKQYFFKPYGKWFAKRLKVFEHFFVQNEQTKDLLCSIGYDNVTISGDTRFDRVIEVAKNVKHFQCVDKFCQTNKKILLAGSSWDADEVILKKATEGLNMKIIVAPHQTDTSHIERLKALFPNAVLFSQYAESDFQTDDLSSQNAELKLQNADVLIIDCIGILSHLYNCCDIAYIGGGFGAGIHNTLEAATFGKPICFGKRYTHFQEAVDLVERKAAFSISDAESLRSILIRLNQDKDFYSHAADVSLSYTKEKAGACQTILKYLNL